MEKVWEDGLGLPARVPCDPGLYRKIPGPCSAAAHARSFPNSGRLLTWGLHAYQGFLGRLEEMPNPLICKISCGWKKISRGWS